MATRWSSTPAVTAPWDEVPMSNPLSFLREQIEQWQREGAWQRLRVLE